MILGRLFGIELTKIDHQNSEDLKNLLMLCCCKCICHQNCSTYIVRKCDSASNHFASSCFITWLKSWLWPMWKGKLNYYIFFIKFGPFYNLHSKVRDCYIEGTSNFAWICCFSHEYWGQIAFFDTKPERVLRIFFIRTSSTYVNFSYSCRIQSTYF